MTSTMRDGKRRYLGRPGNLQTGRTPENLHFCKESAPERMRLEIPFQETGADILWIELLQ